MPWYNRKATRLKNYDYSTPGVYFITICCKDRQELFGTVRKTDTGYYMELSAIGDAVHRQISAMNGHNPAVTMDLFTVMPNHVHLLVRVANTNETDGASQRSNNTVSQFVSLLKRKCNHVCGENLWQRSFHDHVVRGEADYQKIWQYIQSNVNCWEKDCFFER